MRYVVRLCKIDSGEDAGTEQTRTVPVNAAFGERLERHGELLQVIDPKAPGGTERKASDLGFPAIGGRCYLNGGYKSEQWGVMPDKESIAEAKAIYPGWDYDETGAAIIPSERALKEGAAAHKAHMAAEAVES